MHRSNCPRGRICFFHLSQNLRLAQHHRIQAGSHPEEVPNRLRLPVFIKVRLVVRGTQSKILVQEALQIRAAVSRLRQHFHAITGGKNQPFIHPRMFGQAPQRIRQMRLRDRQPLSHFDRRADVIDADELQIHDCTKL